MQSMQLSSTTCSNEFKSICVNIGFMISFLQCFVDFFKNMNQLNYAFHIRTLESSASNKGGTRKRKQKYIKNKKNKRKTSRK